MNAKTLLVIVAEAVLENDLTALAMELGAHGYTVSDVRGAGERGRRAGTWDADRNVRIEIVCEALVAERVAREVAARYFADYAVSLYLADVRVLRSDKY